MRQMLIAVATLAAALTAVSATAADAPLSPKTPWVVDYAETFCTASRSYGTADAPLQLAFRPAPDDQLLQIIVIRRSPYTPAAHEPVTVEFGGQTLKATALLYGAQKSARRIG